MTRCTNHPDTKAKHTAQEAGHLVAICCACYLATGRQPSPFHNCT